MGECLYNTLLCQRQQSRLLPLPLPPYRLRLCHGRRRTHQLGSQKGRKVRYTDNNFFTKALRCFGRLSWNGDTKVSSSPTVHTLAIDKDEFPSIVLATKSSNPREYTAAFIHFRIFDIIFDSALVFVRFIIIIPVATIGSSN